MYDLKKLFAKSDLVPAIVQDAATMDVLMLAYMNEESLKRTLETGYTWFYSRSRAQLWQKGETSGNVQRVLSVVPDCDDDTLLVMVEQTGVACHTGAWSCFFAEPLKPLDPPGPEAVADCGEGGGNEGDGNDSSANGGDANNGRRSA